MVFGSAEATSRPCFMEATTAKHVILRIFQICPHPWRPLCEEYHGEGRKDFGNCGLGV